jgi:hypothetical protein
MNLIDKVYTEWAWRTKSGVPDINNPEDKAILNKLISELVKEEDQEPKAITKKDIIDYINSVELDDKQIVKLYQRVTNFGNYRSIRDKVKQKGYGDKIYKQYSQQIQSIIEDLPIGDSRKFSDFLQKGGAKFPTKSRGGNIIDDISAQTNLPTNVVKAVFRHTAQDEKKRGVGMGELALILLFDNVTNAVGKGDLAIDGQEFEVKGQGAKLGPNLRPLGNQAFIQAFSKFGVEGTNKPSYRGNNYILQNINQLLVDLYNDHGQEVVDTLNQILNSVGLENIDRADFTNATSLNTAIGIKHFLAYQKDEGFKHFMVHDFGAKGGGDTGKFAFVSGSPEKMAKSLKKSNISFQKITPTRFGPRIGIYDSPPTDYLEEDETE